MASTVAGAKVWFITGASSGLGLEMALSALRQGHHVIGTSRDIKTAAMKNPQFEHLGGQWLQLDVGQPRAQKTIEQLFSQQESNLKLESTQKRHWVIVNNAGSSLLGAVEDMSECQITSYLQNNVYGAIRVWKAVLPTLRHHQTGTLITISSIWGFVSKSEHMMYSACKATLESLTESYADLLSPFGIRVMIIEPGGFRTKFPGNASTSDQGITKDYEGKIRAWMDVIEAASKDVTLVNGDPERFAECVVNAVEARGCFQHLWAEQKMGKALRVQLGSDCYEIFGQKLQELNETFAKLSEVARLTDVDV